VLQAFQAAPVADLGFAKVDTHRGLRRGFPEVIFGAGKTPDQVVKIGAEGDRARKAGPGNACHS
jgi:NCAIR mutase (PurE)-related protein